MACYRRKSLASLASDVKVPRQPLFAGESVAAGEKMLEAEEIGLGLKWNERGPAGGASSMPTSGDCGRVPRCVVSPDKLEAGGGEKPLIFAVGNEQVKPDGAADGELLVGNYAGNDQCVAEGEDTAGLENAMEFTEDGRTVRYVAHCVVGIDGIEAGRLKRQRFSSIEKAERYAFVEASRVRGFIGRANSLGVYIGADDSAARLAGK